MTHTSTGGELAVFVRFSSEGYDKTDQGNQSEWSIATADTAMTWEDESQAIVTGTMTDKSLSSAGVESPSALIPRVIYTTSYPDSCCSEPYQVNSDDIRKGGGWHRPWHW